MPAVQLSTPVRNARLNAIENEIGANAVLKIRTGTKPASADAADSGDVLATINLPADWMADAVSGSKAKLGTWEVLEAEGTGTAEHFRVYASDGITCGMQGSCGQGSENLVLDNASIAEGQKVTISTFNLTDGNQ